MCLTRVFQIKMFKMCKIQSNRGWDFDARSWMLWDSKMDAAWLFADARRTPPSIHFRNHFQSFPKSQTLERDCLDSRRPCVITIAYGRQTTKRWGACASFASKESLPCFRISITKPYRAGQKFAASHKAKLPQITSQPSHTKSFLETPWPSSLSACSRANSLCSCWEYRLFHRPAAYPLSRLNLAGSSRSGEKPGTVQVWPLERLQRFPSNAMNFAELCLDSFQCLGFDLLSHGESWIWNHNIFPSPSPVPTCPMSQASPALKWLLLREDEKNGNELGLKDLTAPRRSVLLIKMSDQHVVSPARRHALETYRLIIMII